MLRYDISPLDPEAHLFIVGITIPQPTPGEQFLRLPTWISGSYMIRDFSAHILKEEAYIGDRSVPIEKVDKCTWRIPTVGRKEGEDLYVYYQVWAFDQSVRMAYLDDSRGFFNPGCVFMQALGIAPNKILVNITPPVDEMHEQANEWQVATSLPRAKATSRFGWGLYQASSYDELIDHPVELGNFEVLTFKAHGVRHNAIFSCLPVNFDAQRVTDDLKAICEAEIAFFEPDSLQAPVKEYNFLINVTSNQYGGLEHRASTALFVPAKSLPCVHDKERSKDYVDFLGLCAHEYFHTWNVKRIKPAEFINIDFVRETPTNLLWLFEGFTSYYDSLFLLRAGVIGLSEYAELLTRDLKSVLETSAKEAQTLAQASFDAWIKFYKPTANTVNANVSYYKQGALAAFVMDAALRNRSKGKKNLDDVMRLLWKQYKNSGEHYAGITEASFYETVLDATGIDLTDLIVQLTKTTEPIDYAKYFKPLGIKLKETPVTRVRSMLGLAGKPSEAGFVITHVFDHEVAQWVGLAPGDVLIAIDGVRITRDNIETLLTRYGAGDQMVVHAFRDDKLKAWVVLSGQRSAIKSTAVFAKKLPDLGKSWMVG